MHVSRCIVPSFFECLATAQMMLGQNRSARSSSIEETVEFTNKDFDPSKWKI